MIIENILSLIDEVEIIEEFNSEDILSRMDDSKLEDIKNSTGKFFTNTAGTASYIAASEIIRKKIRDRAIEAAKAAGTEVVGDSILGSILASIGGGIVSSMVISLITSIFSYKKKLTQYRQELPKIQDPQERQQLQNKINTVQQQINQKRITLNQQKSNLSKEIGDIRLKINELERNRNNLSDEELNRLTKYKKLLSDKMKALPKLNV